jgi:twitching motility protein PilU
MQIEPYLKLMVEKGGSDIFFSVGAVPHLKVEGNTVPVGSEALDANAMETMANSIMSDLDRQEFESNLELNFGFSLEDGSRFRANVFKSHGQIAMVLRHIKDTVPTVEELGLPSILNELIMEKRGLILVVGASGAGKSTTLASMIDYRNTNRPGHILAIEDPIEFMHVHKKSVVDQREVGIDTLSYSNALKNALREAPDVIMIGEIRDSETMQHAVHYAETGHLCITTLHASNARQALERVINFFPKDAHNRLLQDLSAHLKAIISQRLVRGLAHKRVAAYEVMPASPFIKDLIENGKISELPDYMERQIMDRVKGFYSFDQTLIDLYKAGKISAHEAVRNADSQHNVHMKIEFETPGALDDVEEVDLSIGES